MSVIATGVNKKVTVRKQPGLGQAALVAGAQDMRRVQSTLDLKKASVASKEIRSTQQRADARHGIRTVDGSINGELSVGSYQLFMESILRQLSLVSVTIVGAAGDIVTASTGTNTGTYTTTAADFLAGSKFKVGMVIRPTGHTGAAISNNGANMVITTLTAKVMTVARTDGKPIVAIAEAGAVTLTEAGKHTFVPITGHTRDYYTIEHNFQDIGQVERFTDCVISTMDIKLPPTGIATVDFGVMGLNMTPATVSMFTAPSPVTSGTALAASNGVIYLAGVAVGLITGMNIKVSGGYTFPDGVVGANVMPDIFPGVVTVDGQVTVLFSDPTYRDLFLNETEATMFAVFTADSTPGSAFTGVTLARVKVGGASKDDGQKGLVMTMPFMSLENFSGGPGTIHHASSICIQDSSFV